MQNYKAKLFERVLNKYITQFELHWGNPLNQLILDYVSSQFRSTTKDMLCLVLDIQFLKPYPKAPSPFYSRIVRQTSEDFSFLFKTECFIPISLITGTQNIFYQRKRKLRKLMYKQLQSSISSTIFSLSSSSENISENNTRYKMPTQMLSYKDSEQLSKMNQDSSLINQLYSEFDIFEPTFPSQKSSSSKGNSMLSKINSQIQNVNRLKYISQSQCLHLIFEYNVIQNPPQMSLMAQDMMTKYKKTPCFQLSEANKAKDEEVVSEEIQQIIQAEVNKFKNMYRKSRSLLENAESSRISRKKIREKAQQYLKKIDNQFDII